MPCRLVRLSWCCVVLCVVGCAASAPAVTVEPPRSELKEKDDDVGQAWDSPLESLGASAAGPTSGKPKVQPPPPLPNPAQAFEGAMAQAQRAKQPAEVEAALKEAVRQADGLTGEERHRAHEAEASFWVHQGDGAKANEATRRWLDACGPEKADACRGSALATWAQVAKLEGAPAPKLAAEVAARVKAETCAAQAEKTARALPCLVEAERTGHARKDAFVVARIALARALTEQHDAKRAPLLRKVDHACTKVQCAALRRRALTALVALDLAANDVNAALKHALADLQVNLEALPASQRLWGRTAELDAVCAKVDASRGAGTCRKAEREVTGGLTFRDYAQQRVGEGLSADLVREVNEHFGPLMQECLAEQARRLVPPDIQRYELRWIVFNDGRVGEAHLRRDLDESDLAKCVRRQFVSWRYPRYDGEWQNVEQSYTVSAVERRRR